MSEFLTAGKKAWITRQANLAKLGVTPKEPTCAPQVSTIDGKKWTLNNKYHYNKSDDIYITYLKAANDSISIPGETHRAMHKAYSAWAGKESTITDLCQEFSFPQNWFAEYKTIHGWTHSQGPFTKEEIEAKPVETLVQEAIQYKRKEWVNEYEKKIIKDQRENAEKWIRYEQSTLRYIERVLSEHRPYTVPKLQLESADEPYALVLPVMDLHFGKFASPVETGQSYSRAECRNLLHSHTAKILNRIAKLGRPDKIISMVGSDWTHIDNVLGTTTKGTPQDIDGTPGLILKEALELAVEHIDALREVAPVELILSSGNHDEYTSIALLLYLRAWYRNCEDVTVHFSLLPRNYISYGNTLIATSHGDETKLPELCKLIPYEARELWATCENAVLYTGHKHYEYSNDDSGILVQQGSSLSGPDRWHNKKGYKLSRRALTGYILYSASGPGGQITSAMTENDKLGNRR
jgi:hypothetical protein